MHSLFRIMIKKTGCKDYALLEKFDGLEVDCIERCRKLFKDHFGIESNHQTGNTFQHSENGTISDFEITFFDSLENLRNSTPDGVFLHTKNK